MFCIKNSSIFNMYETFDCFINVIFNIKSSLSFISQMVSAKNLTNLEKRILLYINIFP